MSGARKANYFNGLTPKPLVIRAWAYRILGSAHFRRSLCPAQDVVSLRGDWHVALSRVFTLEWTRGISVPHNLWVDFEIIDSKILGPCLRGHRMTWKVYNSVGYSPKLWVDFEIINSKVFMLCFRNQHSSFKVLWIHWVPGRCTQWV